MKRTVSQSISPCCNRDFPRTGFRPSNTASAGCFLEHSAAGEVLAQRMACMLDRVGAAAAKASGSMHFYMQPIAALEGAFVRTAAGSRKSMFTTYNYLGLLGHPLIEQNAVAAIQRLGTGTHGSRVLGGTTDLHVRLEQTVARFTGRADAIVFTSGFMANFATLSALLREQDWVFLDRASHASLVDGCAASGANLRRFRHNDADHLANLLAGAPKNALKLVLTDAVFSMDGDLLDLPRISAACRRHGALLMVDEAHSFGVLGANGRGIEEHFGLPSTVDILMGTFSKAVPASGGFICGPALLIEYLRFAARGYVFSGSIAPPLVAAALAALEVIATEGPGRRAVLNRNADRLRARLRAAGLSIGKSCTAIVPVIVGSNEVALSMIRFCQNRGLFVLAALPPVVPPGTARLRLTVTAEHSSRDVDDAADLVIAAYRAVTAGRPVATAQQGV